MFSSCELHAFLVSPSARYREIERHEIIVLATRQKISILLPAQTHPRNLAGLYNEPKMKKQIVGANISPGDLSQNSKGTYKLSALLMFSIVTGYIFRTFF